MIKKIISSTNGLQIMRLAAAMVLLLSSAFPAMAQQPFPFPIQPARTIDSSKFIEIIHADSLQGIQSKTDSTNYQKLLGHVELRQGTTFFYCDSAIRNLTSNIIDAYGHIHINQGDTIHTYSDYLHYLGNDRIATFRDNVKLTDSNMVLTTSLLDYDMNSHIGTYHQGGRLLNGSTVLTSEQGYYYADTKDVYFKSDVVLVDPQYTLATDTLLYNARSKVASFVAPTTINTGKSIIHTSCGYYDTQQNYAHLCDRSSIIDSSHTLSADTLNYDKNTGIGIANGNVVWTDTSHKITVLSNYATSNEKDKSILATEKPLMILERESDTLYLAADTLFSGIIIPGSDTVPARENVENTILVSKPVRDSLHLKTDSMKLHKDVLPDLRSNAVMDSMAALRSTGSDTTTSDTLSTSIFKDHLPDSSRMPVKEIKNQTDTLPHFPTAKILPADTSSLSEISDSIQATTDTLKRQAAVPAIKKAEPDSLASVSDSAKAQPDTSERRYIIAYHHMRMFSDSLQGAADSLYYSDVDSVFRLYKDPVLWVSGNQLTGDTILLHTRNQQAYRLDLQPNGMIVSEAGSGFYNQIKGSVIYGYFKENKLDWMSINGNAETIYFAMDDNNAFIGGSKIKASSMDIHFKNGELYKIAWKNTVDGSMTPLTQAKPEDLKLRNFRWEGERRPVSKTQLMQ